MISAENLDTLNFYIHTFRLNVLFIDYGEEKVVYPAEGEVTRKIPSSFLSIPIQVLRCKLDNIVPIGGKYEKEFLDEIHPVIVDKKVTFKITRRRDKFPLPIIVHLKNDNVNIARMFVEKL